VCKGVGGGGGGGGSMVVFRSEGDGHIKKYFFILVWLRKRCLIRTIPERKTMLMSHRVERKQKVFFFFEVSVLLLSLEK